MKKRLQEYALLAEIIGAAAVVCSLLFVGVQVRQSNSIATTEAIKDGTQLWVKVYTDVYGSYESTAFFRRALHRCEELTADERGRFYSILGEFMAAYDNIYNQYLNGRMPEEIFASIGTTYYGIAEVPCAQEIMRRDFILLPSWLLRPDEIDAMAARRTLMRLPSFLVE